MVTGARPLAEVTTEALKVLYKEIGIVNTVRFINQFTTGYGDYTQEREQLFADMTLDDIVSEIKRKRKTGRFVSKEAKPKRTTSKHKSVQPTRLFRAKPRNARRVQ
jgi:hypothetical protein